MNDDVEIMLTQRGLQRYDEPWEDTYGHMISVYESSAASGPHVWVSIAVSPQMVERGSLSAHLNVEQAEKLRRELTTFIEQAETRWSQ